MHTYECRNSVTFKGSAVFGKFVMRGGKGGKTEVPRNGGGGGGGIREQYYGDLWLAKIPSGQITHLPQ